MTVYGLVNVPCSIAGWGVKHELVIAEITEYISLQQIQVAKWLEHWIFKPAFLNELES